MAIHGSLEEASLPDVLQLLALGKKTGCLSLTEGSLAGHIYLDHGRVSHAAVVTRPSRLGDVLVKGGRITREQLNEAVTQQERDGRKAVGQILVESGRIDSSELEKFARVQVEETVYFLFTWRTGTFTFRSKLRPENADFPVSIDPEGLLLEGARRVDEWSLIEKKVPSFDLVFRMLKDPRQGDGITLTEAQRHVLPLLDGTRDVTSIVEATGMVEFDVGKALYGLITAGFAKLVERRIRMRHLEYRELLAYLVHEAEFADPQRRKDAARHIVDCKDCAQRLKKIHVRRTEELNAMDDEQLAASEPTTVEVQAAQVMKSTSDLLMPVEAAASVAAGAPDAKDERRHAPRRAGADRRGGERRRGERRAARAGPPAGVERRTGGDRRVTRHFGGGRDRRVFAMSDRRAFPDRRGVGMGGTATVPVAVPRRDTDPRRRSSGGRPRATPTRTSRPRTKAPEQPPAAEPGVAQDLPATVETAAVDVAETRQAEPKTPPAATARPETKGATDAPRRSTDIDWLVTPDESVEMLRASRQVATPAIPKNAEPPPPPPPPPRTTSAAAASRPARRREPATTTARAAVRKTSHAPGRGTPAGPPARRLPAARVVGWAAAFVAMAGLGWMARPLLDSFGSAPSTPPGSEPGAVAPARAIVPAGEIPARQTDAPGPRSDSVLVAGGGAPALRSPARPADRDSAPRLDTLPTRPGAGAGAGAEAATEAERAPPPQRQPAPAPPEPQPVAAPVRPTPQPTAPPPTPDSTISDSLAADSAATDSVPEDPLAAPAAAPPPPPRPETDPEILGGAWIRVSPGEAETELGRSIVVVPDLEIESVARPGTGDRAGIRVVQLLASGQRLELFISRPPFLSRSGGRGRGDDDDRISSIRVAPAPTPGSPATGTGRLGSYLVTAKANLTTDELKSLLTRLGPPQR